MLLPYSDSNSTLIIYMYIYISISILSSLKFRLYLFKITLKVIGVHVTCIFLYGNTNCINLRNLAHNEILQN